MGHFARRDSYRMQPIPKLPRIYHVSGSPTRGHEGRLGGLKEHLRAVFKLIPHEVRHTPPKPHRAYQQQANGLETQSRMIHLPRYQTNPLIRPKLLRVAVRQPCMPSLGNTSTQSPAKWLNPTTPVNRHHPALPTPGTKDVTSYPT